MPMVALDQIVEGHNARTLPVPPEAEEGLRRSIAAVGILQPIVLRPVTGQTTLELVFGRRRLRAAAALGWIEAPADVRAMTDAEVEAAQVAENIQRREMHPVDQWRAVRALIQDHGLTFEQAAGSLGLDDRTARRMELLGRLNPTLLKMCEIEMPAPAQLRAIARAPAKAQTQVASRKGLIVSRGETETVAWHEVVNMCATRRISRAAAMFELPGKGIAWDEDLFAQPGADDQFTTADVDAFLKLQTKALEAEVAALVKAKKRHQVALALGEWSLKLPSGYRVVFDGKPERPRKHETVFRAVTPSGRILECVGADIKAEQAAAAKKPMKAGPIADRDTETDDLEDDDGALAEVEEAARAPFTKAGSALIAAAKSLAVRDALATAKLSAGQVIALLVLALDARNVSVNGNPDGFRDLAAQLLGPGGHLIEMTDAGASILGRTAIGRIVHFEGFDRQSLLGCVYSGDAGEWIGAAVAADRALPRFDTPTFLATATNAELKRAAAEADLLTSGTGAQLRDRLAGRAPNYRPEMAAFGAPAPAARRRDDD